MRKHLGIIGAVVLSIFVLSGVALAEDKFAYVDLSRIFSEYGKTKDYDKDLESKEKVYTGAREKKVNEVKDLQNKLNLLNEKEKESKKGDIEAKVKALQDFDRDNTRDLRKEQDEKMKELLKDIEETIKKYAEKEGYTMVFNDRVLVYQTKNYDITDKIVEILNKDYKKR
ncbi:MAG: OmpH family outer membrane protein [Candidatus Omnitrophica bacterium]|nr:OmpH family outer membrane protein [Candidatus Omnitrophota bacterium]